MGYIVTKRILSFKSTIGFGKYYDLTVSMVLSLNPQYIIWSYYHIETIGYSNEVLDYIEITKDFRFDKPGTSKEMYDKFKEHLWLNESIEERDTRRLHEKFILNSEEWAKKSLRSLSSRILNKQHKISSLSSRK